MSARRFLFGHRLRSPLEATDAKHRPVVFEAGDEVCPRPHQLTNLSQASPSRLKASIRRTLSLDQVDELSLSPRTLPVQAAVFYRPPTRGSTDQILPGISGRADGEAEQGRLFAEDMKRSWSTSPGTTRTTEHGLPGLC